MSVIYTPEYTILCTKYVMYADSVHDLDDEWLALEVHSHFSRTLTATSVLYYYSRVWVVHSVQSTRASPT